MSKQSNVDVEFSGEAIPEGLPAWVSLLLYRILQEATTNAVQHAGSATVRVTLRGTPGAHRPRGLRFWNRFRYRSGPQRSRAQA